MNLQLYRIDPPHVRVPMDAIVQISSRNGGGREVFDRDELLMAIVPHIQVTDGSFQIDYDSEELVDVIYVFDCDILAYELTRI